MPLSDYQQGEDPYGYGNQFDYDDPTLFPGGPPPVGEPPPAPPPTAPPPASYYITGTPSQTLIDALYPGYKVVNGQWQYTGTGTGSISNPALAADYLNKLWGPLSVRDYHGFWDALGITTGTSSPETIKTYAPILRAAGFIPNANAHGDYTDLTLPTGEILDPLKEGGKGGWQWLLNPAGGRRQAVNVGNFTEPWTEPFVPPDWTTGAYQSPDVPDYGDFAAPAPFEAPDENAVFADPSYKLRLREGEDVIMNSGAAQGRSLEGGFLKDLLKYGQMFGSTEYGNIYGRKSSEYDRNYSNLLSAYTTNRDTMLGKYGLQKGSYDSLWNAKQQSMDTAYRQYLDREKAFRANQDSAYDKYMRAAGLGANASA